MGAQYEAQGTGRRGPFAPGKPRARGPGVRVLLLALIALLGLVMVGQLAYHFIAAPRLVLRRLTLQGDPVLGVEEVLAASGIALGQSLPAIDAERTARLLEEGCPAVKRAVVRKQYPDTLVIDMEGRRALATALVSAPEGTLPVVFDEEGMIFGAGAGAVTGDVPVISGIGFAQWRPGTRLPVVLKPLLDDLRRLQAEEPALYAFVSEIAVKRTGEHDLELLVYPAAYSTPIRAGSRMSADLLKNAALLVDVLRRERLEDRISEVDLRSREVVYREKRD